MPSETPSAGGPQPGAIPGGQLDQDKEAMWIEVIAKMDQVYSDLIRYETELEAKNSELEEAQAFISSVIASVSDVLIVVDAAGKILQVNPAFVRLLGVAEDRLVGSRFGDWLVKDEGVTHPDPARAASETADTELRFATLSGPSEMMAMVTSPRLDHAGRPSGLVLTGRPIGELRRAYQALSRAHQELQQAQRKLIEQEKMASLGRLVAGVAHELNNPISFVYGNIHALDRYRQRLSAFFAELQQGGDPAELRRKHRVDAIFADLSPLIDGTLEGAVRISDIVRNLRRLSFARPGTHEPVDLAKVARNAAVWAARAKGERTSVEISTVADAIVDGQEGQLHQVLVNLVENALDAVRGRVDPNVRIDVAVVGEMVEVRVSDNGPGVPADIADKMFEPFFTTKVVGEGTGLGLWISYSIAREHGGELALVPTPVGACFLLRLKRAAA